MDIELLYELQRVKQFLISENADGGPRSLVLRMLDPSLSPPSTLEEEKKWCKCLGGGRHFRQF